MKGVNAVEKIKEYERAEFELVRIEINDAIATSTPIQTPDGDEDNFGWA